ncbi:MAG: MlaA family lipoprotein [Methylococcales bacterium]
MKTTIQQKMAWYLPVFAVLFWLSGCATTPATDPRDPWEGWNRGVQSFNDGADDYVIKPVAEGYQWITPSFVDQGVTNFFNNIGDITVTINDLLQFKFGQGSEDFTRFLINTTLGVVGLVDVGTMLEFERHNEDFGQTLGAWGVPTGPYLVLPLLGPSSPRETFGLVGDAATNPLFYINFPAVTWSLTTLRFVDLRADLLSASRIVEEAALDRYEFFRNAYLQRRDYLVHDGNPPIEDEEILDEDLDEDLKLEEEPEGKPLQE